MGRDNPRRALGQCLSGCRDPPRRKVDMQQQRFDRGSRALTPGPDLVEKMQLAPVAAQRLRRHRDPVADVDLVFLGLDLVLGAFVAGAVLRTLLPHDLHDSLMARLSAVGYGFLIPIFFVTSGMELDIAAMSSSPAAIALVPVFVVMMLIARGLPALWLYRDVLPRRQRMALALHSGTQLRSWSQFRPSRSSGERCPAAAAPRWLWEP